MRKAAWEPPMCKFGNETKLYQQRLYFILLFEDMDFLQPLNF